MLPKPVECGVQPNMSNSSHAELTHTVNRADDGCDAGHTVNGKADGERSFELKGHATGQYT